MKVIFVLLLSLTCVFSTVPPPPTCSSSLGPLTLGIASGASTQVVGPDLPYGGNAILTWVHSAWTAIPGAKWIWDANQVTDPAHNQISYFFDKFSIRGNPSSATLCLAADNFVSVYVNGHLVYNDITGTTFTSPVSVNLGLYVTSGDNQIAFEVTNLGVSGSDKQSNPAGLLYRLDVEYSLPI
jgi:hypothetical protein